MLKTLKSILILSIVITIMKECACLESVEVKLRQGLLSGRVQKTFLNGKVYNVFKGIPYAEPPVGELRFKPPKPHTGWESLYQAYKNEPPCVQFSSKLQIDHEIKVIGSEDCLYLNVFTPSLEGSRAVIVFDFHDNYRTGYNGTRTYSPEFLTEEDVVVVTVSHRLGLLGYLTTEDDVIPPNNGLRDYILALKWIKDNIKYFGGDPERVTLMGSKGGGALVNNLLYSKAATGLFHAVIMQSGTSHEPTYFGKKPRDFAFKLAEVLEIQAEDSSTLLKKLQNVDYEIMLANETRVVDPDYFEKYQYEIYPFSPVIEKDGPQAIITTLPEHGKIINDVPVLIGFNTREGLYIISDIVMMPLLLNNHEFLTHLPIRSDFRFDRNNSAYENYKDEIIQYYLKEGYLSYFNILDYSIYIGDVLANYALNEAAKKLSTELKSPTYYYKFDFLGVLNENMIYLAKGSRTTIEYWGATVGDEICYIHLCSQIRDNYEELKKLAIDQNEFKVLKKMIRLWSNFAKTGNPTPDDKDDVLKSFKWKPIDKTSDNMAYLLITKTLKMSQNPLGNRKKFWDSILEKYSKLAVEGVVQDIEKPREEL